MIPQIAFNLFDTKQINHKWIELGGGVEGHVFDGEEFSRNNYLNLLESSIQNVKKLNPKKFTLHFPTSNASYIDNEKMIKHLYEFIDLSVKYDFEILTIHSNDFTKIEEFESYDVLKRRNKFVEFFYKLDNELNECKLNIAIENMPIIGNMGKEFDSVFLMPESFNDIRSMTNIKVTFDICHWLITYYTLKSISLLKQEFFELDVLEFLKIPNIIHFHFASFKNLLIPFNEGICQEGILPWNGLPNEAVLRNIIRKINKKFPNDTGIVFEINEECYLERKNAFKILKWFNHVKGEYCNGV